ncbi:MAG: CoB--CoM heterodisulfide reductase iron-sulfur subunit B family protein [Deltaproteobacteria bacterium]|jgi:heterodisulfide reductase subunit B|nr:CoB--CoM heterodisulfide reductase iron-sulfur subunit B family protein [Deltaproteobacteria bacterium]
MSEKAYAYYPGCSSGGTSKEYDASTRAVCAALGIRLVDVPDWNCCGSTPAHTVDHALSAALSARNLAQSESLGLDTFITPCPSCLKNTHNAIEHMRDGAFRAEVDKLTLRPLQREHKAQSVLQVLLEDITPEGLAAKVRKPLSGLKVAAYYGCLMTRPGRSMHFDDEENPTSMDRLLEAAGAEVLPFPFKMECCGGAFGVPRPDVPARLGGRILSLAREAGADALAAACPLCQMNLDMRQEQIKAAGRLRFHLPVFYYTQLIGLALGLEESTLLLDKLVVNPKPALAKIGRRPVQGDEAAKQGSAA